MSAVVQPQLDSPNIPKQRGRKKKITTTLVSTLVAPILKKPRRTRDEIALITLDNVLLQMKTDKSNMAEAVAKYASIIPTQEQADEIHHEHSALYNMLIERKSFNTLTNFTEGEVLDILHDLEPLCIVENKRGPRFAVDVEEGLILLLIYYCTGMEMTKLSALTGVAIASAHRSIDRIRVKLRELLANRWEKNKERPIPVASQRFPQIALNFDHTTIGVYKTMWCLSKIKRVFRW